MGADSRAYPTYCHFGSYKRTDPHSPHTTLLDIHADSCQQVSILLYRLSWKSLDFSLRKVTTNDTPYVTYSRSLAYVPPLTLSYAA
jgi:hypothetical protein